MTTLYYPVEEALLHDYFGIPRPSRLRGINIWEPDGLAPRKAVHLEPDSSGDEEEESALANSVARIALSRIQKRLPQWASASEDHLVFGRTIRETGGGDLLLLPLHLFTLNWADSGPGFSWPEAYHVTWFPIFNRFVVTASADSPDVWGYEDRAIGSFEDGVDAIEGAKEVIIGFWREQCSGGDAGRWAYLFDTGAVGEDEAKRWADVVWPTDGEDECSLDAGSLEEGRT